MRLTFRNIWHKYVETGHLFIKIYRGVEWPLSRKLRLSTRLIY